MFKKISLIVCIACLLTGCSETALVQHNLLFSDMENKVKKEVSKNLTELIALETIDDQDLMGEYEQQLEQGSLLGSFHYFPDLEIGDVSLNNIEKTCGAVNFNFMSSNTIKNVIIEFYFSKVSDSSTIYRIPLVPANTCIFCSINIPDSAEKIGVRSITYEKASIAVGDIINIHTDNDSMRMVSNNTLQFKIKEKTRYFILDDLGNILDDLTLQGSGLVVTASGAAFAREVIQN